MSKSCKVAGCSKKYHAKGLCKVHYNNARKHGHAEYCNWTRRGSTVAWLKSHAKTWTRRDECLTWPFSKGPDGYGHLFYKGHTRIASRVMCILVHGDPPNDGWYDAAHSCGKGHLGCVNPHHLSWKTRAENLADALVHGTRRRGSQIWSAKLTESDVVAIKKLIEVDGIPHSKIAEKYGVRRQSIGSIATGETWGHIPSPLNFERRETRNVS